MKSLLVTILLFSSAAMGQPFWLDEDETGAIVHAAVNNDSVTTRQLAEVAEIKTLIYLTLGFAPEGILLEKGALSVLETCPRLESLRIAKYELTDDDLRFLPRLESLEHLTIELPGLLMGDKRGEGGLTDASIGSFARLKNLESLVLRGRGDFSDTFVKGISALPELTHLELHSDRLTDESLKTLATNPRIKRLSIGSPLFTDSGVGALARMPALEEIEIASPRLTPESVRALAPISGLKVLDLPINDIDRLSMEVIANMKFMKRLILRDAAMGDDEFDALKDHPSLESLFLENATLTGKSKVVLDSMGKLTFAQFGKDSWIRVFNGSEED